MSDLPGIQSGVQQGSLARAQAAAEGAQRAAQDGRTDEAAAKFEALLATMLVKEMRRALPGGTLFPGAGSDVYDAWFDEHIGAALAKGDQLGLSQEVRLALAQRAEEDPS